MKYSTRVSDAVHILAFIALDPKGSLSSGSIAESIHTNPGCVRQLMSSLRKADLLFSIKGHPKPAWPDSLPPLPCWMFIKQSKEKSRFSIWIHIPIPSAVSAFIFSFPFRIILIRYRQRQRKKCRRSRCRISWTATARNS